LHGLSFVFDIDVGPSQEVKVKGVFFLHYFISHSYHFKHKYLRLHRLFEVRTLSSLVLSQNGRRHLVIELEFTIGLEEGDGQFRVLLPVLLVSLVVLIARVQLVFVKHNGA